MPSIKVHSEGKWICCPGGTLSQTGAWQPHSAWSTAVRQSGDFHLGRMTAHGPGHRMTRQSRAHCPSCSSCDIPERSVDAYQMAPVPALIWAVPGREVAGPPLGGQGCFLKWLLACWNLPVIPTASHFWPQATWASKLPSLQGFSLGPLWKQNRHRKRQPDCSSFFKYIMIQTASSSWLENRETPIHKVGYPLYKC